MDLFTLTPDEAVIVALALVAQAGVVTLLQEPVLQGLSGLALAVRLVDSSQKLVAEEAKAASWPQLFGIPVLCFVLGWGLMAEGGEARTTPIDRPEQAWSELPHTPNRDTLSARPGVPVGFVLVDGAFEGFSQALAAVVWQPEVDLLTAARGTMAYGTRVLSHELGGEELITSFEELWTHCPPSDPSQLQPGVPFTRLFSRESANEQVDCGALLEAFDEAQGRAAGLATQDFLKDGLPTWNELMAQAPSGMGRAELSRWIVNAPIEATIREYVAQASDGPHMGRKTEATFTTEETYLTEALYSNPIGEAGLWILTLFDEQAPLMAQKAAIAQAFNGFADLIPVARGFVAAGFVLTFPLVLFALACGFTRPLVGWLIGRLTLACYPAAANFVFSMVQSVSSWQDVLEEKPWLASEAVMVGGLAALEALTLRMQSVYIVAEGGLFVGLVIATTGLTSVSLLGGQRASAVAGWGMGVATSTIVGLASVGGALGSRVAALVGAGSSAQGASTPDGDGSGGSPLAAAASSGPGPQAAVAPGGPTGSGGAPRPNPGVGSSGPPGPKPTPGAAAEPPKPTTGPNPGGDPPKEPKTAKHGQAPPRKAPPRNAGVRGVRGEPT